MPQPAGPDPATRDLLDRARGAPRRRFEVAADPGPEPEFLRASPLPPGATLGPAGENGVQLIVRPKPKPSPWFMEHDTGSMRDYLRGELAIGEGN
ncbi:MAG: hypothetical protein ABSG63_14205 [Spirochaetia bacterium]